MSAHNFPKHVGQTRKGQRYDSRHARARRLAARKHNDQDPCARCGHPLGPMGPNLHYDHDDTDPTGETYLGFAHGSTPCPTCGRRCNIQAGSDEGNRRLLGVLVGGPNACPHHDDCRSVHSRDW